MALPVRCAASLRLAGADLLLLRVSDRSSAVTDRSFLGKAYRQVKDLPHIGVAEPSQRGRGLPEMDLVLIKKMNQLISAALMRSVSNIGGF